MSDENDGLKKGTFSKHTPKHVIIEVCTSTGEPTNAVTGYIAGRSPPEIITGVRGGVSPYLEAGFIFSP